MKLWQVFWLTSIPAGLPIPKNSDQDLPDILQGLQLRVQYRNYTGFPLIIATDDRYDTKISGTKVTKKKSRATVTAFYLGANALKQF